jgi:hypothetical protein
MASPQGLWGQSKSDAEVRPTEQSNQLHDTHREATTEAHTASYTFSDQAQTASNDRDAKAYEPFGSTSEMTGREDRLLESEELVSHEKGQSGNVNSSRQHVATADFSPNSWGKELAAIVFAVAILIAIAVILSVYNHREQPDWPSAITLNALIAVLSTLLRSSMMTAVDEGEWTSLSLRPSVT